MKPRSLWLSLSLLLLVGALAQPVWADTSYVVQPGDTLTRIATRFNVTVDALIRANKLANPNALQVGQTLTIPDGQPAAPASAATPSAPSAAPGSYTVRPGDSVTRVARQFNITIEELMRANGLTNTTLQIGQVLVIPGGSSAPATPMPGVYDRITGDATFVRRIRSALDWLQANDAEAFGRVNQYVSIIRVSPYRDRAQAVPLQGGCLVRALARSSMSTPMVAALLFHEATHCQQFATQGALNVKTAEVDAYSQQLAFMERHGFPAEQIDYYRRVLAYYESQPNDGKPIPPPSF